MGVEGLEVGGDGFGLDFFFLVVEEEEEESAETVGVDGFEDEEVEVEVEEEGSVAP